jgi:hypothetical protein
MPLRRLVSGAHHPCMKTFPRVLAVLLLASAPALAQDVRVTISGEVAPGVYGRVDIGTRPPPPLVYPQAVLIVGQPKPPPAIYMHVPPGHAKNWRKHCSRYNACNVPVYFVKSAEYEPGYKGPGKGAGKGKGKDG